VPPKNRHLNSELADHADRRNSQHVIKTMFVIDLNLDLNHARLDVHCRSFFKREEKGQLFPLLHGQRI